MSPCEVSCIGSTTIKEKKTTYSKAVNPAISPTTTTTKNSELPLLLGDRSHPENCGSGSCHFLLTFQKDKKKVERIHAARVASRPGQLLVV
jgi:hypothetical protein